MEARLSLEEVASNLEALVERLAREDMLIGIEHDGQTSVCLAPIALVQQWRDRRSALLFKLLRPESPDLDLDQEVMDFANEEIHEMRALNRWKAERALGDDAGKVVRRADDRSPTQGA